MHKINIYYKSLLVIFFYFFLFISCKKDNKISNYKIFNYNQDSDIASLDPAFAIKQGNIWAVNQLFNGLVSLNKKLGIEPALAKNWTISKDGKTYTFKIRNDVYFHDSPEFADGKGRKLTAHDFVYSFKRIIDAKTASPGAWIFNDKVLKINDSTYSDTCFYALNDSIFKIQLQKPYSPFLQILTIPYAYVVPKEVVEKWQKDFRTHPVGTGAFKFKMWEEKTTLVFEKNKNYWKYDTLGVRLPYLDGVHISFIGDRNIVFMLFKQKKIDFISGLDESSRDIVFNSDGSIGKKFSSEFNVQKIPYLNTEYLGFQLDKSTYQDSKNPILNLKVRQALNYSLNREQMVQYLLSNIGKAGQNGMIPSFLLSKKSVKGYNYNVEKAQKLLAEAGYPNSKGLPTLTLSTLTRFPYKEICEFAQREWSKIGIKVNIETLDYPTLLENIAKGNIKFFRASWQGDYSDPENYMALFYSKNFTPHGPNKTRYFNPIFDKLYENTLIENDENKRFNNYYKMDSLVMEQSPVIVLFYDEVIRLLQKNISNLEADAMNSLVLENVIKN
ncbi:MAG: ABC transporter substrate-binding protein [Cytophagales bacterium]|nr:MAG: ABC transporter substrate-binding protein [Cytophagales bacterium]